MLVKYSKAKIDQVINDEEHSLDDEGTRKALAKAAEEAAKASKKAEVVEDSSNLEN